MPRGHRSARSHNYYPTSSLATTPTTQYAPLSSRPNLTNISTTPYYTQPQQQTLQSMSQQQQQQQNQYTQQQTPTQQNGYPNGVGGPVQLPMSHHYQHPQHHSHLPPHQTHPHHAPHQNPPPLVSLRPSSGAWSASDDQTLMTARAQGMNWAPIQQSYFPTKTPNACRKRHERLIERRSADDWDGIKLETLAKHYMLMRKEIWGPLAERTGEKWTTVEMKCMSQGIKNLGTSARSCNRRERLLEVSGGGGGGRGEHGGGVGNGVGGGNGGYVSPHPQAVSLPFEARGDDSGYADELEQEYEADGASERSVGSNGGNNGGYHGGHGYSASGGSAGSMGMMNGGMVGGNGMVGNGMNGGMVGGGMVDMRGMDVRYAQHQSRLPSMDMGIDAIINRTPTGANGAR